MSALSTNTQTAMSALSTSTHTAMSALSTDSRLQCRHCLPTHRLQCRHCLPTHTLQCRHCLPTHRLQCRHCLLTDCNVATVCQQQIAVSALSTNTQTAMSVLSANRLADRRLCWPCLRQLLTALLALSAHRPNRLQTARLALAKNGLNDCPQSCLSFLGPSHNLSVKDNFVSQSTGIPAINGRRTCWSLRSFCFE